MHNVLENYVETEVAITPDPCSKPEAAIVQATTQSMLALQVGDTIATIFGDKAQRKSSDGDELVFNAVLSLNQSQKIEDWSNKTVQQTG